MEGGAWQQLNVGWEEISEMHVGSECLSGGVASRVSCVCVRVVLCTYMKLNVHAYTHSTYYVVTHIHTMSLRLLLEGQTHGMGRAWLSKSDQHAHTIYVYTTTRLRPFGTLPHREGSDFYQYILYMWTVRQLQVHKVGGSGHIRYHPYSVCRTHYLYMTRL